jgi:hypothetical protein
LRRFAGFSRVTADHGAANARLAHENSAPAVGAIDR